jgi:hypothetical protein
MIDRFALIIGAMKSGTTSLFSHLGQHTEVCRSRIKEPNFFIAERNWPEGFDWYHSLWSWRPGRHTVAIEASTGYTKAPYFDGVVDRIATAPGDFRFIYLMRHPIERLESQYRHQILKEKRSANVAETELITPEMLDISRYAMQIERYIERFGADRVLLLAFEDLKAAPEKLLRRVCEFLGIEPSFEFKGVRTPHNPSQVDDPLMPLMERSRLVVKLSRIIPVRYKQALRNYMAREVRVDTRLTQRQRDYVLGELRPDIERLGTQFGFDTSRWNLDDA